MISPLICLASSILNSVLPDAVGPTITTKNGLLMSLNSYPSLYFSLTLVFGSIQTYDSKSFLFHLQIKFHVFYLHKVGLLYDLFQRRLNFFPNLRIPLP